MNNKILISRVVSPLSLALLMSTFAFLTAGASDLGIFGGFQFTQQPAAQKQSTPAQKRTKSPDYIRNVVTDTANMPGMPHYTGSTTVPSVNVTWDARNQDRPTYDMSFDAKESPETVINWYRQAMAGYGWTVDPNGGLLISATKDGRNCQIAIDVSSKDGYSTEVDVLYR